jgi:hypothetical protein
MNNGSRTVFERSGGTVQLSFRETGDQLVKAAQLRLWPRAGINTFDVSRPAATGLLWRTTT